MLRPPPTSPLFPYTTLFRSLEIVEHDFRHAPRAFHEHAISNQKLTLIGYTLHIARVSRTIKHRVLTKSDLLCDRSTAFDSHRRYRSIILCSLDLVGEIRTSDRHSFSRARNRNVARRVVVGGWIMRLSRCES